VRSLLWAPQLPSYLGLPFIAVLKKEIKKDKERGRWIGKDRKRGESPPCLCLILEAGNRR
jgi:hypothetical protein